MSLSMIALMSMLLMTFSPKPGYGQGAVPTKLDACPTSPNCVSSTAEASDGVHYIAPFQLKGTGATSLATLRQIIEAQPRTKIVRSEGNYLRAEFTSLILRFTDDVEFLFDESTQTLQVRSASRIGYSDMGANRKRIELLRDLYTK